MSDIAQSSTDAPRRGGRAGEIATIYRAEPVEAVLLIALLCGLSWAPFWVGSTGDFPWAFNALYFPSLAIIYEASLLIRGKSHPFAAKRLAVPIGLFLPVVLWIYVQMSPLVPASLVHPIWVMASEVLGRPLAGTISVNSNVSALALMRLITDASVLWLAIQLCRDPARAILALRWVAITVAAYSAYGIILTAVYASDIPFFRVPTATGYVRSTFVNKNSFATYAGLGLIASLALILRLYRHEVPDAQGLMSYRLTKLIDATGRRGWLLLAVGFITLVALLGSVSRGGVLASVLAVAVVLALAMTRKRRRRTEQLEAILVVAAVGFASFAVFGDLIVGRITTAGLQDTSRFAVYQITTRAIFDSPLIGFGYGTFADVFPMYRDNSLSVHNVWDMAHNTYLEVWLGLGLIGGTMLMGAIGYLVFLTVAGAITRRRDATPAIIGAACSILVGLQALVDFSLQIEAVSLTYMALLGTGVAESVSSRVAVSD
jgi:O-antigen ligase